MNSSLISPKSSDTGVPYERLTVRLLLSFEEAQPFRSAWNDLILRSGADVYQTFDWCRLWWQYYGDRRQLQLLLWFSGEELVGLVPAFIETLWLGPIHLRVAKLVGADYTLHLCNLPVLAEALPWVVPQAMQHFLGKQRCDLLLFGPFSGPAARLEETLAAGLSEGGVVARAEALGNSCNTYFHLPGSFEEYLKGLGKQHRDNLKRKLTQFSKAHQVSFDVVSQPEKLATEFESFRLLHNAQWRAEGKMGHFDDWPQAESFNRDLVRTLGDLGMVRFHRILADGQVVCSQYSFVLGDTHYWRLPARACSETWGRFSFGYLGLVKMFEASITEGHARVEGGRGHYAYKLHIGGREWPLRTLQFMRRGPGVSARVRAFKMLASALNLAYYKVIFARVALRVPVLQRPLWPLWIRSTW